MITLDNLTFNYNPGKHLSPPAVDAVNAEISPGIFLLAGENGSGKTTLMHIIDGLLRPTSGSCLIDGAETARRLPSTLGKVFFLPDNFECPFATIGELGERHGAFYPRFDTGMLRENLHAFGLETDSRLKSLSLGMRRKAYAAYALALGTEILLLDEPTNGMDISAKRELRRMIGRCTAPESTVIVSTHTIDDLRSLYDALIVMHRGRMLLSMPLDVLSSRLAFVSGFEPHPDALYQEPSLGVFRALVPNDGTIETDVDFGLLYMGLLSPSRQKIINQLNCIPEYKDHDN